METPMKKLQYILAIAAAAIFASSIVYANVATTVDYNTSTAIFAAALLCGSMSAATAVISRMKAGERYYVPSAIAFVLLSTLDTMINSTLVFIVVLLGFAVTEFGLVYGAVKSKGEKLTVAKYIGMAVAMLVWYLASSVTLG